MLCFTGKLCTVVIFIFWRTVSVFVVLCANFPDECSTEYVSLMSAVPKFAAEACGVLLYPSSYPVDEYIL